jgi:hypothetical protein
MNNREFSCNTCMLARTVEEHEIDLQKLLLIRVSSIKDFLYIEKFEIFLYELVSSEES